MNEGAKKHEKLRIPKGATKREILKSIDGRKNYKVPYLAPHQNKSKGFVYGDFKIKGVWLTENQIIGIYLGRWTNDEVKTK